MDSRMGNQEKMNRYGEALTKFSEAKQLPELFRTIFRAAFLPYRSPETLGLFLKEISYFDYSHPEELGNAYEHLLSIMSAQGDAGQFRTPRHIIDFIVDVINPTKDDKVLDPACGTAGFLVSTYNHILEQHDGKDDPHKKEKPLTPDERKKLMQNLQGYDIDPTMVRIAQVNMYLHQFKNPQIFQYDSLTSEERWSEKFDVILANPPFMSPKGGIKPHNKFSIPSNRAEVLFVDYIINHLRPKGRAGIIVPEGIIFQSGNAYKALRRNLVEKGLYAVVSLPGGVFQPYSGVKTSILLIDNEVAKQKTEIAFVKISADGFELSNTRRPISANDLPNALEFLSNWVEGQSEESQLINLVSREEIVSNGDYNLSSERYKTGKDFSNAKWPLVELGKICKVYQPKTITASQILEDGPFEVYGANGVIGYYDKFNHSDSEVVITCRGSTCGTINFTKPKTWITGNAMVVSPKDETLSKKFLLYLLTASDLTSVITGTAQPQITGASLMPYEIPLPPLEVQEQIVAELDGYAAIISGAKQIVDNWRPRIEVDNEWPKLKLSDLCQLITKGTTPTSVGFEFTDIGINFIKVESIKGNGQFIESKFAHIPEECHNSLSRSQLKEGDVLFSIAGTLGRTAVVPSEILPANTNQALAILRLKSGAEVFPQFLEYLLRTDLAIDQSAQSTTGVAQQNISLGQLGEYLLPIPPLPIQGLLVDKVKKEESLVRGALFLAEQFEARTQAVIAKLWSE
jgi:type I restriction enzyme M protein